ncbi:chemotaxis protein CheC [Halobacterium salinarum]|uniref:chemotaxis protein CheC n=1 Tax=Halobacterium salinarum TaxID=2242 RepID=UPI002555BA91|nr:chemotaxis protein CheC [Halobacterium salinarum]MDL0125500.1 chemotaxis protein CheC [Halobacterium salinarum]MDL0134473.1 chemotaxis protein CheC [Halobacterium salinarum]MDL0135445.1 chemotaxis protein CheC [Halobacterium salinarum]MDL0144429.1 chemotaxis protein CheC [Halobacterium salinarum]
MRVDLDAVASFSRTGDEGGQRAADSLETLTGIPANCQLTRTALVDADGLSVFLGDSWERISVEFDGALTGRAVLSFDEAFADHVEDELGVGAAALPEVANILTSGFVDVWAADDEDTIEIEPPDRLEDEHRVVQDAAVIDDCAFVFESQIVLSSTRGTCRFAVLPDVESFGSYVTEPDAEFALSDLANHIQVASVSAEAVSSHLEMMTGTDATLVESHVDFVPVERVPSLLDDAAYEGAIFESEGVVDSVIAILFDETEPGAVAELLLGDADAGAEMAESAVSELGNITASGFIDQWANALDTTIDISTPSHVRDAGRAVLDTVAAAYGERADTIAVVNATITLGPDVTCRVCTFPSPEDADQLADIADNLAADASEES